MPQFLFLLFGNRVPRRAPSGDSLDLAVWVIGISRAANRRQAFGGRSTAAQEKFGHPCAPSPAGPACDSRSR